MPGGDGSGPNGMGPMTGRAAGFCAGGTMPGFATPTPGRGGFGSGRGYGFGRGIGRGMGNGFRGGRGGRWAAPAYGYAPPNYGAPAAPQQESEVLRGQAEYLQNALAEIQQRLAELEADQAAK
jgi:uncharacterized protein DUF5320